MILDKWKDEVVYNQRTLYDLAKELDNLGWYDEEVWTLVIDTAIHKGKVQNTHFLHTLLNIMTRMNKNETECPHFYQKLQPKIDEYLKKHYYGQEDRQWRYNADKCEWRPIQELIERREEADISKFKLTKADVDEGILLRAREAEKKLKRLRMAKYSKDLFDEIIAEMMKDKKTLLEMMAELDADEGSIYESQTRIAKR